jgi:plastocyanin
MAIMNKLLRVGSADERWLARYSFLIIVLLATIACSGPAYQADGQIVAGWLRATHDFPASRPSSISWQAVPAAQPLEQARIRIEHSAFNPPTLTIPAGTTVSWTNVDIEERAITSSTSLFESARLGPGATYSFRFAAAGTYVYACPLHPGMTARIVVQ